MKLARYIYEYWKSNLAIPQISQSILPSRERWIITKFIVNIQILIDQLPEILHQLICDATEQRLSESEAFGHRDSSTDRSNPPIQPKASTP